MSLSSLSGVGRSPRPEEDVEARPEEDVEARVATSLRRDALTKAHVTPRQPVRLVPRPDGSFHYDGLGFDAEILRPGGSAGRCRNDDKKAERQNQPSVGCQPQKTSVKIILLIHGAV